MARRGRFVVVEDGDRVSYVDPRTGAIQWTGHRGLVPTKGDGATDGFSENTLQTESDSS